MHPVHVQDEFAALKVALVHDGTNAVTLSMEEQRRLIPAEELRDHPEAGPVFHDRVVEQQAEFLNLGTPPLSLAELARQAAREAPVSRAYLATRNRVLVEQSVQWLSGEDWQVAVVELDHRAA
jgi:hypothetical protein